MAKVTITTIANLDNPSTATAQLNNNFQEIAEVIETLLSRNGTTPNTMSASLDMNNQRILNLPFPISDQEPARHGDIQTYVDAAEAAQLAAEIAQAAAELAETNAETAEENAEAALADLLEHYMGTFSEDPETGIDGADLVPGTMYFNDNVNQLRVWVEDKVYANGDEVWAGGLEVFVEYWLPIPMTTLRSMTDVEADDITDAQVLAWEAGTEVFEPVSLTGSIVSYTDGTADLDATNVQDAIDEILLRTSLGQYDISFWIEGLMEGGETLFRMVAPRSFTIPVGATGSIANAGTGANTLGGISIRKNDVQQGTISFAAAETAGVFTLAGDVVFNVGDVLSLVSTEADTLLKNIAITLVTLR